MLSTEQPTLRNFWNATAPVYSLAVLGDRCRHRTAKLSKGWNRDDREEDCSAAELIAWDKAIIEKDREMLEAADPEAIVDRSRKIVMHMLSDRPGMLMRNRLLALLKAHSEAEAPK